MTPEMKVSRELQAIAGELKSRIDAVAGEPMAFALFVFPMGRLGNTNYVSNGNRADIVKLIAEWHERCAAGPDIPLHTKS